MEILHFAADKDGIFCIDPIDYLDRELSSVDVFLNSLDSLEPGELVFTSVCERSDEFEMITKYMGGV